MSALCGNLITGVTRRRHPLVNAFIVILIHANAQNKDDNHLDVKFPD